MMLSWTSRPTEVAHLLNPAFCSVLLHEAVSGYEQELETGMPFALSFLVLPLVLHKPSRDVLPRTVATKFHSWVHNNQELRVDFHKRAEWLSPHTKESLHFGMRAGILVVLDEGLLSAPKHSCKDPGWPSQTEPGTCRSSARFVGRWFTRAGEAATIFAILGVTP